MATITLTAEDAGPVELKTSEIERIRRMTDSERGLHDAATRVDYAPTVYAKEEPEKVALLVAANGVPTLGRLLLPNGWPVWFDAGKARGPLPVPNSAPQDSIRSALEIAGKMQYVRSTPQEVHDLIAAAGGNALPIPRAGAGGAAPSLEGMGAPRLIWDDDIPELTIAPIS